MTTEQLQTENERLKAENERLKAENERLKRALREAVFYAQAALK